MGNKSDGTWSRMMGPVLRKQGASLGPERKFSTSPEGLGHYAARARDSRTKRVSERPGSICSRFERAGIVKAASLNSAGGLHIGPGGDGWGSARDEGKEGAEG